MSRDFPDWINPWTAAQGRRQFSGTVPVSRMTRLVPLLEEGTGEAKFEARFEVDEDRRPVIHLSVEADLRMLCQASLEPYDQRVERESLLAVVESEGEIPLLAPDNDPVQADNGRVALASLVEDELLLGLPQVPRNPDVTSVQYSTGETDREEPDSAPSAQTDESSKPNPFAVLQGKLGEKARSGTEGTDS